MSKRLREEHRVVHYETTNNTINNQGAIYGNVTNANTGTMTISYINAESTSKALVDEIEAAKLVIFDYSEINDEQKKRLAEILDDTKNSFTSGKDVEQNKKSFKDAICFMGNAGSKLITALSHLSNILKFLGISIPSST